jgi:hypothetical protein
MVGEIGLGALAAVIHPYPTQAEAIRQTGDLYNRRVGCAPYPRELIINLFSD